MKKIILNLVIVLFSLSNFAQKFDNLAKTPPMGWNSWNKYGCDVDEKLIMKMTDEIVNSGMHEVGYEYVVIDDCWQVGRSEDGEIIIDKERFPNGMKKLADYIHSKGLKFGIYSCAGTKTCQERPGSRGYEFQDARTYAKWEVDFFKYDWCNTSTQNAQASYSIMRDALFAAGRPIVFSICEWGKSEPWEWGKDVGHLWRTTGDIRDSWKSMISIVDKEKDLFKFAKPGSWNDPDMLEVGNGGMTTEEYKTHFSLWCMLAAPLMAGNDLSDMSTETKEILMNKDLIAINQDVLGKQGFVYRDNGDYQIWIKQLDNKEKAICLLNRSDEVKKVQVDFNLLLKANSSIGWRTYIDPYELKDYSVRDLWEHENVNIGEGTIYVTIPPHAVKVFKFVRNQ